MRPPLIAHPSLADGAGDDVMASIDGFLLPSIDTKDVEPYFPAHKRAAIYRSLVQGVGHASRVKGEDGEDVESAPSTVPEIDPDSYAVVINAETRAQLEVEAIAREAYRGTANVQLIGRRERPPPVNLQFGHINNRSLEPAAIKRLARSLKTHGLTPHIAPIPVCATAEQVNFAALLKSFVDPSEIPLIQWKNGAKDPEGPAIIAAGGQHRQAALAMHLESELVALEAQEKVTKKLKHRRPQDKGDLPAYEEALAQAEAELTRAAREYVGKTMWTVTVYDFGAYTTSSNPLHITC